MFTNLDFTYPATFEADPDGGFVIVFPDLPEANTKGHDDAEARANAIDRLEAALEALGHSFKIGLTTAACRRRDAPSATQNANCPCRGSSRRSVPVPANANWPETRT